MSATFVMGDIGEPVRHIELEPLETPAFVPSEPAAPEPVKEPQHV
ncbi:hypothetical protein SCB71_06490 [Herbiconiux sp. KACC 21604]|nr:hypothetical protein [Herbiconiux sp. SALV-R1]WPO87887.1 hypothetical protein SCB71_06490 [Herbiconiux sp. KACC 21604]